MHPTRLRRLWILWSAVLAVLMGSFAPTVSHLVRQANVVGWAEVCSLRAPTALKVAAKAGSSEPDSAPVHALDHCPYCAMHDTALGLPPTMATALPLLAGGHEVPRLFLAAPHTLYAWSAAQARAPPLRA